MEMNKSMASNEKPSGHSKKKSGGHVKNEDPTMDFFNLGTSFKPKIIKTSKEQVSNDRKSTAPSIIAQDEEDEKFYDCEEIKAKESYMYQLLREEADRNNKNGQYSSTSEMETNKFVSSVDGAFAHGIHDDFQLRNHFNFSSQSKEVKLPIIKDRENIIKLINSEKVTVICGHTGSGKTTQVPQFILEEHARTNKAVNIIVTQPRKIAAKSIAKRVCDERGWKLGGIVGYKVGLDKENASLDTRLLYCTTGIFKKMIIAKKHLNDWTHVILDEVHEREMDMDFVLLLCKRLINTNSRNAKLILMSATIDTDQFQNYFSWPIISSDTRRNMEYSAGLYEIPKCKLYPVIDYYLDDLEKDQRIKEGIPVWPCNFEIEAPYLLDECIQVANKVMLKLDDIEQNNSLNEQKGAVLVFLPGEAEISRVKKTLEDTSKIYRKAWWILPLHSRIPFEETQRIFENRKGHRKIILSTNVAESSLTIPDIYYVIDFCLQKLITADPHTNYVALKLHWADKNSCTQRKGRAGRVRSGIIFRMIPQDFYNMLSNSGSAEMLRAPLDKVILDTKLLDFGPPKELLALAMEPPKLKNIHNTMMRLKEIGALLTTTNGCVVPDDGDLTVLGEIIASLPVDICLGKLIILGHLFNVIEECIIIAAGMSNNSLFAMPFGRRLKAYADKLFWADRSFSDCLALLVAYQTWQRKSKTGEFNRIPENKWCKQRHLQLKVLKEMRQTIDEIKIALRRHYIDTTSLPNRFDRRQCKPDQIITTSEEDCLKLKIVIFGAFYPNYFIRNGLGLDEKEVYKEVNYQDPVSSIYFTNFPADQAKYGLLYEDQVKNMFDGFDNRNINVEFEGSKIIVQLASDKYGDKVNPNTHQNFDITQNESINLTGDILHEVYVAMKLRSEPNEMLKLKLFKPDIAQQKMLMIQKRLYNQTLLPMSATLVGIRNPPSLDQNILELEITYCKNPNSFWINYLDLKDQVNNIDSKQLARLDVEIEQIMNKKSLLKQVDSVREVQLNLIYLAPFEGCFYRARIDRIGLKERNVQVSFIDYGNVETIPVTALYEIDMDLLKRYPSLAKTPALAHECSLSFTKPNQLRSERGVWDEYSINIFKNTVEGSNNLDDPIRFVGKVTSVVPNSCPKSGPLIYLVIFKVDSKADIARLAKLNYPFEHSINYHLQNTKDSKGRYLAVYGQENYMSKVNHQLRSNHHLFNSADKLQREKYQMDSVRVKKRDNLEDTILNPNILGEGTEVWDERTMSVQLKGPHHPLQFHVVSSHRIGSCKKANVEPDSVNSVLLDKSPNDKHDIWMVAGHVGTNPAGDALVLRSTTLMPNREGLGALLAMTFAPRVEMRCDPSLKRYTGCLTGLGYRKQGWGKKRPQPKSLHSNDGSSEITGWGNSSNEPAVECVPYHPEHDMEVQFDVNIDNEDIDVINQLRYRISIALTRIDERREDGSLLPLEERIREKPVRITIADLLMKDQDIIQNIIGKLLISKQRKCITKRPFKHDYHWRELPPEKRLFCASVQNEDKLLYRMITQIKFLEDLFKDLSLNK